MKIGSLFSGYGGLEMGVQSVLGGDVAWHVEYDAAPSKVLSHHWPTVPNHGDVTTTDWSAVEPVEVLTGGFPCQDLSMAGRRAGMRPGTRSGLWADYLLAIAKLRPNLVVVENVRGLLSGCAESDLEPCPGCMGVSDFHRPVLRALGRVLGDLADLGYDARWLGVRAADAGAPHERFRVFVLAYPQRDERPREREQQPRGTALARSGEDAPYAAHLVVDRPRNARDGWAEPANRCIATADTDGGRRGARVEDVLSRQFDSGRSPAPDAADHHGGRGSGARAASGRAWGEYGPAIARWEETISRAAPEPTIAGRLSAPFVEWMMGLPEGHVTAPEIGLTRSQQLKALGNGVVPQQAALAIRSLLGAA